MNQRVNGGGPSSKPMSDFEEKALATFGSDAVDGVKGIFGLMSHELLTVECATSPTKTAPSLKSPLSLLLPLLRNYYR